MEGWELLFEVRYHFGWPGGGRNGQNCPNFIREYLVGSSRKEKILTKIGGKLDMLQATFWLFFCWDILVSARYEVGRRKNCQKVPNVLRMVGLYFKISQFNFPQTISIPRWYRYGFLLFLAFLKRNLLKECNYGSYKCTVYLLELV